MTGVGSDARRAGKKVEKDGEMGQFNQGGQGGPHPRGDVSRTESSMRTSYTAGWGKALRAEGTACSKALGKSPLWS